MLEVETAFAVFIYAGAFTISTLGCFMLAAIIEAAVTGELLPKKEEQNESD